MMSANHGALAVERAVMEAASAGHAVSLDEIGGESAILAEAPALARSRVFGDLVDAVLADYVRFSTSDALVSFVVDGLLANENANVVAHALDALATARLQNPRPIIKALDLRVRDQKAADGLRAEVAAGLVRFAFTDSRWQAEAVSAVHALEFIADDFAGPIVCRLASAVYEQFRDDECLRLLERMSDVPATSSQAAYERGVLQVMGALEGASLPEIADDLRKARRWMEKSANAAEDRRDAKTYLMLIDALLPIAERGKSPDPTLAESLRLEATAHAIWDRPTPGVDWLQPPTSAVLEWIPLADNLVRLSGRLSEASWLDAGQVLNDVLRLYTATRATTPNVGSVVRPAIESAFVEERGLLAHLDQWLSTGGNEEISRQDAVELRKNIQRRVDGGPPGKFPRTPATGGGTSSKRFRPD